VDSEGRQIKAWLNKIQTNKIPLLTVYKCRKRKRERAECPLSRYAKSNESKIFEN
jgi:hypothetical protein